MRFYARKGHPIEVSAGSRARATPHGKWQPKLSTLLKQLGLTAKLTQGYWQWPREELQDMLNAANAARLDLIREHHPDRSGDATKAAEVNDTWRKVRKIFKQHGFEPS